MWNLCRAAGKVSDTEQLALSDLCLKTSQGLLPASEVVSMPADDIYCYATLQNLADASLHEHHCIPLCCCRQAGQQLPSAATKHALYQFLQELLTDNPFLVPEVQIDQLSRAQDADMPHVSITDRCLLQVTCRLKSNMSACCCLDQLYIAAVAVLYFLGAA